MYAIRSYYEQQPKFNDDKAIFVTQGKSVEVVIQLTSQKITPEKKTEESVEEESDTQDDQQSEEHRITSYNVCYTKLLR